MADYDARPQPQAAAGTRALTRCQLQADELDLTAGLTGLARTSPARTASTKYSVR